MADPGVLTEAEPTGSAATTSYPPGTILEPCVICDGKGDVDGAACPGGKMMHVAPVGINSGQLERMHEHSQAAELILHAIIHGHARWEWFSVGNRDSGELWLGGLRHTLNLDSQGVPIVTQNARAAILQHVG